MTVLTHLPGDHSPAPGHRRSASGDLPFHSDRLVSYPRRAGRERVLRAAANGYYRWAIAGALGVYAVIISGAVVTAMGATGGCLTWPLCSGQAFPMHHLSAVHMFHRYVVLALGVLLIYAAWRCVFAGPKGSTLWWLAILSVVAFVAQVIVGAATIWLDFQAHWRALHLTAATAVWTASAGMAIIAYMNARTLWGGRLSSSPVDQDGQ